MLLQPREEFIGKLMMMLKAQPCSSLGAPISSVEDFDSWEDRVSEEVIHIFDDNANVLYLVVRYAFQTGFTSNAPVIVIFSIMCCCCFCY